MKKFRKRKFDFRFKNSIHAITFIRKVLMRDPKLSRDYMYSKLNKLYKNVDYSKDYIGIQDATDILKDENLFFLTLPFLEKRGLISKFKAGRNVYIPIEEVEQEMLRREMCCYKDFQLYEVEKHNKEYNQIIKHRTKYRRKQKVYLKINGQRWYAGEYAEGRMGKVKKVIKYFYSYKELFDQKNNPHFGRRSFPKLFKYLFNNGLDGFNMDDWFKWPRKLKNTK